MKRGAQVPLFDLSKEPKPKPSKHVRIEPPAPKPREPNEPQIVPLVSHDGETLHIDFVRGEPLIGRTSHYEPKPPLIVRQMPPISPYTGLRCAEHTHHPGPWHGRDVEPPGPEPRAAKHKATKPDAGRFIAALRASAAGSTYVAANKERAAHNRIVGCGFVVRGAEGDYEPMVSSRPDLVEACRVASRELIKAAVELGAGPVDIPVILMALNVE